MDQFSKYDSAFCGNIPIHIINTVQEYGALVVLDRPALHIRQVSENVSSIFGKDVKELINKSLQELIRPEDNDLLISIIDKNDSEEQILIWQLNNNRHYVNIHVKENMVLAEINLQPLKAGQQDTFTSQYQDIRSSIAAIEKAEDLSAACEIAARELKRISGFDKVMIYAFDKDWNGNVLAEAMEPDMESYIGFTFPASDIPKPARDLYLRNAYRFIPDREFKPMKLYPVINPISGSFLDMSTCNVRAVAAVHIEYLKNMHVMASMSVRIIRDNALWGLIACHHKTARQVDQQLCAVLELLSSVISSKISSLEHGAYHNVNTRLKSVYTELMESIYQGGRLEDSLLADGAGVRTLLGASGVAITYRKKLITAGEMPDKQTIEDLILWLHLKQLRKVFSTDALPSVFDLDEKFREIASGLLVIPIHSAQDEYIIVFRPEYIRTTNWGGNPEERIRFEENQQIYHPRHSFKLWQEQVRGYSKPWLQDEILIAENLRSFIFELLSPDR
ncbi:GAF domain-containing protein [Chitinophaga pendula]|uniref:GAF domain-containing protein n=1 Tax=Chitinophaga TaxID=79328 RepID=UPI000BAF4C64|nr:MULTISPECIES: GAF domain-containing protein [Chitinophaga]ASZ14207.1 phytochrome [Chitinophaga sp. MD30]UCJ08156.1 GAF domain-containing protein [Chitinophaga pendula]